MIQTPVLLLGFALFFYACTKGPARTSMIWQQFRKRWRNPWLMFAIVMAALIVLTPEFFALGLLGDTAFFDLLVLSLSLQLHEFALRAFRGWVGMMARGLRWMGIPSIGLLYLIAISRVLIGKTLSMYQKAVGRVLREPEHRMI